MFPAWMYFLAGWITAGVAGVLLVAVLGFRIGYQTLWNDVMGGMVRASSERLDIPSDVIAELRAAGAAIDSAGNPTNVTEHDTILVKPDPTLGWVLRPQVTVRSFLLRTQMPLNLDPPVVNVRADAQLSDAAQAYLNARSRLSYTYSTDSDAFRRTVPVVESGEKILMIGDSVMFGVGVNDEDTIASRLQSLLGSRYRVVNAAVGGYSGDQAIEMARRRVEGDRYRALIYVACQNDFMIERGVTFADQAQEVLDRLAALSSAFDGNVIVMLETYMEYTLRDVLGDAGWPGRLITRTDDLRHGLAGIAAERRFKLIDWTTIVENYGKSSGSVFSRFALYADHAHLSPLGSALAAEQLRDALIELGLVR